MKTIKRNQVEFIVSRTISHLNTIGYLKERKAKDITEANVYDLAVQLWKELRQINEEVKD